VQGNVYMLSGAGANIAVQVGSDGVLLVDSGRADMANAVIAALRQLTPAPLQMIINSTGDADHTGGNEAVARAGRRLTSALGPGGGATVGAAIIARQAVMDRMIKEKAPDCALPTTTYDIYPTSSLYFNDEGIELRHMPAAHSDGDSLVFFRRSDVVSAGEIFNTNLYPFIDIEHGGSVDGVVAALNALLEITIPALKQERGTYVIPGRGRLADEADVSEYRDMVTIVRDRVRALLARKLTLEQVKAERPTLDYDGRYGGTEGPWTPDRFVEAVYRSLSRTAVAPATRPAGGQRR
jgi:glyoxylase-like metal-dependent hydrolase (beta-lactamase superfamily II)